MIENENDEINIGAGSQPIETDYHQDQFSQPMPGQQPGEAPAVESWLDSLPEDLKQSKVLSKFNGVEDLAKAYDSLSDILGKRVTEFTEEDWAKYVDAQSKHFEIPSTIEDYYIDRPPLEDGSIHALNDTEFGLLKELSFDLGLSKDQAQALYTGANSILNGINQERVQGQTKYLQEQESLFEKNWGNAMEEKQQMMANCLEKFLPDVSGKDTAYWADKITSLGLDHDFDFCNLLAKIGESVSESRSIGYNNLAPMDAEMRLNQMRSDPTIMSIVTNSLHPNHKQLSEEFDYLIRAKLG